MPEPLMTKERFEQLFDANEHLDRIDAPAYLNHKGNILAVEAVYDDENSCWYWEYLSAQLQ